MEFKKAISVLFLCAVFAGLVSGECKTTLDSKYTWDLTPLCKPEGYHLTVTSDNDVYDYWFNLCDNVNKPSKCSSSKEGLAYQSEQQSTGCQLLATSGPGQWSYTDSNNPEAGVKVLFTGGDGPCSSGSNRQLTINMKCNKDATKEKPGDPASVSEIPAKSCKYEVEWSSYYGCPNQGGGGGGPSGMSGGWWFFIIVMVGTTLYCAIGVIYKYKRLGVTGVEMVPNVDFWRDLPGLTKDGCLFTYRKIFKRGEPSGSYETVA